MGEKSTGFSPWRGVFWPVHWHELKKLLPMLLIFFLLSFDYNVLRTMKDVLVVTAESSGAEIIPFIKVWVMFPGSILMTFLFARLSSRFSREHVFYIMLGIFLGYFFLFAFVLYPYRESLHFHSIANQLELILPEGFSGFIAMVRYWSFTLFYVMAELWSNIILFLLFWGFANQVTRMHEAKRFYGLFGIGANFSGIVAGGVSIYISQLEMPIFNFLGNAQGARWEQAMDSLILLVLFGGFLAMGVFRWMHVKGKATDEFSSEQENQNANISLKESCKGVFQSRYLFFLAFMVVAYNLVINLVEVLWKHEVSVLYPDPNDFSIYMNQVTAVIGVIATLTSLFVSGNLIRACGWTFAALVTPFVLFITSIGFFSFLFLQDFEGVSGLLAFLGMSPMGLVVFFGTIQNCLSRAAKYTLYDATKEMAFIPLEPQEKTKAKAVVDGICSRLGKSGGSVLHQLFLMVCTSLSASAPYIAAVLAAVMSFWIVAVTQMGKRFRTEQSKMPAYVCETVKK